ncbi:MAG: class I SAM-dependent methyltransferase [Patescibacteria group bacterium]
MTDWDYFRPNFEYQETLKNSFELSAWIGHINFGYDLVANTKPEVIVELGTHWGVSFFSFCQAVKDQHLTSRLYAVDTWRGEKHAGAYGEKVINTVKKIQKKYFKSLHINLLRKTFDEARDEFEDQSIDLLHIDGLHTYEAVKHDYEYWLPKMTKTGIILFHDTAEKERGFGVYRLWEELAGRIGQGIELPHCHGLGVLCLDKRAWAEYESMKRAWRVYYALCYEKQHLTEDLLGAITKKKEAENRACLIEENVRLANQIGDAGRRIDGLGAALDEIRRSTSYRLLCLPGAVRSAIGRQT